MPLLTATMCMCVFYFHVKNNIIDMFGYVEPTMHMKCIFQNFRLYDIRIYRASGIELVFICDGKIVARGHEKVGPQLFVSWSLLKQEVEYGDSPHSNMRKILRKFSPGFYGMVERKLKAYEKHILKQNKN